MVLSRCRPSRCPSVACSPLRCCMTFPHISCFPYIFPQRTETVRKNECPSDSSSHCPLHPTNPPGLDHLYHHAQGHGRQHPTVRVVVLSLMGHPFSTSLHYGNSGWLQVYSSHCLLPFVAKPYERAVDTVTLSPSSLLTHPSPWTSLSSPLLCPPHPSGSEVSALWTPSFI